MKRVYPFSLTDGGGFRAVQMMLQEVDVFFGSDRSRKSSCETSKKGHTLPKTNMDPPKMMVSNMNFLFQGPIFRYHVDFSVVYFYLPKINETGKTKDSRC